MANLTDIERLNYYEGEFLGAADFQAEQEYHRDMRRRHNVGQHTWGIVSGLDLILIPNGLTAANGSAVDIYVQPGMAVDGFGREIVVLNKVQITQDLFAAYANVNIPGAQTMYLWISYAQLMLQPPSDICTQINKPGAFGRVQEAFALTATKDATGPTNNLIVVDGKSLAAPVAPGSPPPPPPLPGDIIVPNDDSIPYQEFASDDSTVNWYIAIGQVSWDPSTGLFENRADLAANGRQYAGNVTSAVLSPTSSLTIQNRFAPDPLPTDPNGPNGIFYGGVAVEVGGSLQVDRLLEAKQNVLIDGTPDPANSKLSPLTINASSADQSLLQFRDSSGAPKWSIWETPPATNPAGLNFGETDNSGNPAASELFIQKGGNVGIGTPNPTQNLTINAGLNIDSGKQNNGSSLNPGLSFGSNATPTEGIASNQTGGGTNASGLDFYTAGSARLSILNTGKIGAGTSQPQQALSINAGLNIDQANANSGTLNPGPGLTFGSASGEGIASNRNAGVSQLGLDFYTNFRVRMSIDNAGAVKANGNLTVGSGPINLLPVPQAGTLTVNGNRSLLLGTDQGNWHWIMAGGTAEFAGGATGNNALGFSYDSATGQGSVLLNSNWNLYVAGNLGVGGSKSGYVVDRFISHNGEKFEQGDVVVLREHANLHFYGSENKIPLVTVELTHKPHDTRVCGVVDEPVASAGSLRDLDRSNFGAESVGLMVTLGAYAHCKVDADIAPIAVGDLLTTSPSRGYAQKLDAKGSTRPGAIIGKALSALKKGKGKISVLVSHQ